MTLPNEVKFKVRAIALDLETFTVAQMARVTALNPASIRTELQRMKREGYLTSEPVREGKSGRGAPPHRYQLTDDPEARLEMARSIEPFFSPPSPTALLPLSLHYRAAVELIERLETGELSRTERETVLRDAHHHLDLATEEEGIDIRPEEETAAAAAHLDLLRARLAIAAGQWKEAESRLVAAHRVFSDHGLDEMASRTESLQSALVVERTLAQSPADSALPDRLLTGIEGISGALPLPTVRRMLRGLRAVAASGWQASAIESLSRTLEMYATRDLVSASNKAVQMELRQEAEEMTQKEPAHSLTPRSTQQRDVPIAAPDFFYPPASHRHDS